MTVDLDRRTRHDADATPALTPAVFFSGEFLRLAADNGRLVAEGMRFLGVPALAVTVGDESWTITDHGTTVGVVSGVAPRALHLTLTPAQFSDWAQNQQSFNGMIVARDLQFDPDDMRAVSCWDALTHTLLAGWPVVDPELAFVDRHGAPLDLHRIFGPDDDPADIAHFLREAGYLHLRGWIDPADAAAIVDDMDRVLPDYVEGDGKSWWATVDDGQRLCVRLQEFVEHSPTTAQILSSERWDQLRRTLAAHEELLRAPVEGRIIEALRKPIGVISGPSDMSFHRDCHLGRHMYECAGTTVGIALTPTSAANGRLQVVAGSHRVMVPVVVAMTDPYMPVVGIDTEPGDVTVHLSCTLHESTPPITAERRVMYTGFGLPQRGPEPGNDALRRLRERVTDIAREQLEESTPGPA